MAQTTMKAKKRKKVKQHKKRTRAELADLAQKMVNGDLFTDRHLGKEGTMLAQVFMPVMFGAFDGIEKKVNMVYADKTRDPASPMAINGFPTYMSCRILWKNEAEEFWAMVKDLSEAKKAALEKVKKK